MLSYEEFDITVYCTACDTANNVTVGDDCTYTPTTADEECPYIEEHTYTLDPPQCLNCGKPLGEV